MRRKTTLLLVGALLAALAIGVAAPAVSAHSDADAQTTDDPDAQNTTEAQAQYIAEWMETRMGSDGVESFERETGTSVDEVAHALAENVGPADGPWSGPGGDAEYGPGAGYGFQSPCGGPMMPGGNGYGPGAWGGNGGTTGPGGFGSGGYGPGMGGHGMGGGMGGSW